MWHRTRSIARRSFVCRDHHWARALAREKDRQTDGNHGLPAEDKNAPVMLLRIHTRWVHTCTCREAGSQIPPTQAPLCTLHPSRKSHSSSLPDEGTIPGRACPTSVHMQRNKCLEDRKRPAKCVVWIFLADTSAPRAIVAASRWWVTSSTDCEESVTTA